MTDIAFWTLIAVVVLFGVFAVLAYLAELMARRNERE